jgi:hypothetical protein
LLLDYTHDQLRGSVVGVISSTIVGGRLPFQLELWISQ